VLNHTIQWDEVLIRNEKTGRTCFKMPDPVVHLDIPRTKYRILVKIVFMAKTQT
jgi:hypothetical protein